MQSCDQQDQYAITKQLLEWWAEWVMSYKPGAIQKSSVVPPSSSKSLKITDHDAVVIDQAIAALKHRNHEIGYITKSYLFHGGNSTATAEHLAKMGWRGRRIDRKTVARDYQAGVMWIHEWLSDKKLNYFGR